MLGFVVFLVLNQLKKTDPKNIDTSIRDDITSAQEFLPFQDIRNSVIDLGGHDYRMIIECSSINYYLKTEEEREMIEASYQGFLNSLTFPIVNYIQTRVLDNSKIADMIKQEAIEAANLYPQLEEYGLEYAKEISNLSKVINNNKQKKKYIIIPYNEAVDLEELSEDEKYEFSIKELENRASIIIDGILSVGISSRLLNTKELAELVYSTFHRDNYSDYENIFNGEFLSLIINPTENIMEKMFDEKRLNWIIGESQTRIETELLDMNINSELREKCKNLINELNKFKGEGE